MVPLWLSPIGSGKPGLRLIALGHRVPGCTPDDYRRSG